jgi:hypothetical protein
MIARRHRVNSLALTGLAALALFTGGCTRPKPVKFNNDMARATLELAAEGKKFKAAVDSFKAAGGSNGSTDLRSARDRCSAKLEEIQKKYEKAHFPPKAAKQAEELLDRFKDYLATQEKIVGQMTDIVKLAEANPPAEDQMDQIDALMKKIAENGASGHSGIKEAQEEFFKEASLKLDEG